MSIIYKCCRIIWIIITIFLWGLLFYLATHRSGSVEILYRYSLKYFIFLCFFAVVCLLTAASNHTPIFNKLYDKKHSLLLLCVSVLSSLIVAEVTVRLSNPLGISYYSEISSYHLDKLPDKELIYKHKSSWETVYQGVQCRFNEYGLRDDPILPKMENEIRILLLGDSVAFGWGVDQEETFASRLQNILGKRVTFPVRVINTGVGSYNTVQEFTYLKNEGILLEPDFIIVVYVPNDITVHPPVHNPQEELSFQGKSPPQVLNLVLTRSWMYRLLWHAYFYGSFSKSEEKNNKFDGNLPGVRYSMNAIKDILKICKENGIRICFFYFRWQVIHRDYLLNHLQENVSPYKVLDIGKWFEGKDLKEYINSVIDTHPNSAAHQIIAEKMSNYLIDNKYFDNIPDLSNGS